MRLLIIADIHGDYEALDTLIAKLDPSSFDAVICPGDFTNLYTTPPEFDQLSIAELIIEKLLAIGKPLLCVPGNHDPYEILEVLDDYGVNCHARLRQLQGINFIGFGGALTPFNTPFEPPEEETKAALEHLAAKAENPLVIITHAPPKNTTLDKTSNGEHVGSEALRSIIALRKPMLALSAHIQESKGVDHIGNSVLFYPGAVIDGSYGLVTINGDKVHCEAKTFPLPTKKRGLVIDQSL